MENRREKDPLMTALFLALAYAILILIAMGCRAQVHSNGYNVEVEVLKQKDTL